METGGAGGSKFFGPAPGLGVFFFGDVQKMSRPWSETGRAGKFLDVSGGMLGWRRVLECATENGLA